MPPSSDFPHDATAYRYEGEALREAWGLLHRGDRVAYPDDVWVNRALAAFPGAAPESFDGDVAALAARVQESWRLFHAGEFKAATKCAGQCGLLAHAAANKAAGIHATYLEKDAARQRAGFMGAVKRAGRAIEILPDDPNSHYFHAFNLGRHSQSISIVEALKQGTGGKIQASLKRTLELAPDHAEAHTAMGMYHAEIVAKVGRLVGGMTYGASSGAALEHFEKALELTPEAPIAHIEYGNGLYLLFGERRLDEITDLYVRASEMRPRDAMERLDIEAALAELE